MDLEIVKLSEVSQTEKDKSMISLTCGIFKKKMVQINLFTKQKQSHRRRKQIYSYQGQKELGREKLGDSVRFSSVAQLCPSLCDPMGYSTPGFPALHHVLEFAQTHVRWVGDATQPSHLLLFSSLPALNFSQHLGVFHQGASLAFWQICLQVTFRQSFPVSLS